MARERGYSFFADYLSQFFAFLIFTF